MIVFLCIMCTGQRCRCSSAVGVPRQQKGQNQNFPLGDYNIKAHEDTRDSEHQRNTSNVRKKVVIVTEMLCGNRWLLRKFVIQEGKRPGHTFIGGCCGLLRRRGGYGDREKAFSPLQDG